MATKKTATKKTSGTAGKKIAEGVIESLLEKLGAEEPPSSERELGRWILGKLLIEIVSKLLQGGGEMKFASGDILRIVQAIREYDASDEKKQPTGIRVEWVEPEKQ